MVEAERAVFPKGYMIYILVGLERVKLAQIRKPIRLVLTLCFGWICFPIANSLWFT